MKYWMLVQRFLASCIDLLIIYLPTLLFSHSIFRDRMLSSLADLLASLIFIFYNMLAVSSFSGKTIGKFFAKIKVDLPSFNLVNVAQREGIKVIYFLPFAGPIFVVLSLICYIIKGKFIHDLIGGGEVHVS